jgi:prevent-host-death family protein
MKIVNIHEAKTHLSQLIQGVLEGEPFVIAKAGKPLVRVTALEAEERARRRIGFLSPPAMSSRSQTFHRCTRILSTAF